MNRTYWELVQDQFILTGRLYRDGARDLAVESLQMDVLINGTWIQNAIGPDGAFGQLLISDYKEAMSKKDDDYAETFREAK